MLCDLRVLVVALIVPLESLAFFIGQVVFDVRATAASKLGSSRKSNLDLIRLYFFVSFLLVHHSFHFNKFGNGMVFVWCYLF